MKNFENIKYRIEVITTSKKTGKTESGYTKLLSGDVTDKHLAKAIKETKKYFEEVQEEMNCFTFIKLQVVDATTDTIIKSEVI